MSRLIENALRILDAAEDAVKAGSTCPDRTILVNAQGGIEMMDGCEWSFEGLLAERSARMVLRVQRFGAKIRVEGREGLERCSLERIMAAERPAGIGQLPPAALG